jgi:hypothetical protein
MISVLFLFWGKAREFATHLITKVRLSQNGYVRPSRQVVQATRGNV